uniref:Holin n=1 Tax=viral metagenome TaxID=1070528 RepID=A0A6M3KK09_9ZZZZ
MNELTESFKYLQFPALVLAALVIFWLFKDRKDSNKTIDNLADKVSTLSEIVREGSTLNKLLIEKFLRKD